MRHNHNGNHGKRVPVAGKGDKGNTLSSTILGRGKNDQTIVSVVYITASPTFDGPIGGYSTASAPGVGDPVRQSTRPPPIPDTTNGQKQTPQSTPKALSTSNDRPTASPSRPVTSFSSATDMTSISHTPDTTIGFNEPAVTSNTPSSTAPGAALNSGMSGGAKAGLAFGIIILIGLILGAILFFIRKKKEKEFAEMDNEKAVAGNAGHNANPPPMTSGVQSTPPQINMRPMTQFSPDFGGSRASSGTLLSGATVAAGAGAARSLTRPEPAVRNHEDGQPHNPPATPPKAAGSDSNPFNDPVNPFGNHAATSAPTSPALSTRADIPAPLKVRTPTPETASVRAASPENTASAATAVSGATGAVVATGVSAGAAAVGTEPKGRKPAHLENINNQNAAPAWARDGPPPSPALSGDSVSVTSSVAVPAMGPGPNNVHRVQLDFKPSMDDEIELRAGQLIRLLHEYDDGWALCVRLDRSQQGVAPRTCLSARPVKPRPRGPPPGSPGYRGPPMMAPPGSRPMSPAHGRMSPGPNPNAPRFMPPRNGPPGSPNTGYRPSTPQGRPMSPFQFPQVPRSLSPGPGARIPAPRSMSPGPYGPGGMQRPPIPISQRRRSNSASGAFGRVHPPPGPSSLGAPVQQPSSQPQPQQLEQQPKPVPSLALKRPIERKPLPSQARESSSSA